MFWFFLSPWLLPAYPHLRQSHGSSELPYQKFYHLTHPRGVLTNTFIRSYFQLKWSEHWLDTSKQWSLLTNASNNNRVSIEGWKLPIIVVSSSCGGLNAILKYNTYKLHLLHFLFWNFEFLTSLYLFYDLLHSEVYLGLPFFLWIFSSEKKNTQFLI